MKISVEKSNELKNIAKNILSKYRQNLLNVHPFIGNIAMNLDLIPIRDKRCSTAMTDGKTIYFDIDFLSKLNEKEGTFVLGHEVWHVVMMHFLRGEKYNHMIFNIASDMEVNQIMEFDGFIPPADVIFPNNRHSRTCEYNFADGLSAEEYYDLLIKYNKSNKEDFKNEGNSSKNFKRGGSPCQGQFDDHFDKSADYDSMKNDLKNEKITDKYGDKEFDDDFDPGKIKNENEARAIAEEIRQNIVSSAQAYERLRGELPGHIKKIMSVILESKMSWKEELAKFITAGFENRTSWNAPNRRFAWNGTYLPRHTGDMMKIAIGIDTSGSCSEDCEKFLSEVSAIAKTFGSYELHVIQCDTAVKDYQMFDENNTVDSAIGKFEFKGFGGTELHPIFDYIKDNEIDVNGVLIFTDGYCEDFEDDGSIDLPILWTLISKENKADNLKIGEKIYMK